MGPAGCDVHANMQPCPAPLLQSMCALGRFLAGRTQQIRLKGTASQLWDRVRLLGFRLCHEPHNCAFGVMCRCSEPCAKR